VRVSGFDAVPQVGDVFQIVASEREARALLDEIEQAAGGPQKRNFADLVTRLSEGKLAQLKVVLKADTQGSLEALEASLSQLATDKVTVKVIHGAVGAVSESDVIMAAASDGIVLAFRVTVPGAVERTAEVHGVRIRSYEVIYLLLDEVTGLLTGLLEPEETETVLGHLEVKGVFFQKKGEQIVGGRVTDGLAKRVTFRLQRAGAEVGTGRVTSLRRVDKDIKEAKEGTECGMRVESSVAVLEGDVMEFYLREFKKKED
jgi:translation initiation factor IF-2